EVDEDLAKRGGKSPPARLDVGLLRRPERHGAFEPALPLERVERAELRGREHVARDVEDLVASRARLDVDAELGRSRDAARDEARVVRRVEEDAARGIRRGLSILPELPYPGVRG